MVVRSSVKFWPLALKQKHLTWAWTMLASNFHQDPRFFYSTLNVSKTDSFTWIDSNDSAWLKSSVLGWFLNTRNVFGPDVAGARSLRLCILTTWLNARDIISCSSQSDFSRAVLSCRQLSRGWSSHSLRHSLPLEFRRELSDTTADVEEGRAVKTPEDLASMAITPVLQQLKPTKGLESDLITAISATSETSWSW